MDLRSFMNTIETGCYENMRLTGSRHLIKRANVGRACIKNVSRVGRHFNSGQEATREHYSQRFLQFIFHFGLM